MPLFNFFRLSMQSNRKHWYAPREPLSMISNGRCPLSTMMINLSISVSMNKTIVSRPRITYLCPKESLKPVSKIHISVISGILWVISWLLEVQVGFNSMLYLLYIGFGVSPIFWHMLDIAFVSRLPEILSAISDQWRSNWWHARFWC